MVINTHLNHDIRKQITYFPLQKTIQKGKYRCQIIVNIQQEKKKKPKVKCLFFKMSIKINIAVLLAMRKEFSNKNNRLVIFLGLCFLSFLTVSPPVYLRYFIATLQKWLSVLLLFAMEDNTKTRMYTHKDTGICMWKMFHCKHYFQRTKYSIRS